MNLSNNYNTIFDKLVHEIWNGKKIKYDFNLFKEYKKEFKGMLNKALNNKSSRIKNKTNHQEDLLQKTLEANTVAFSAVKAGGAIAEINDVFKDSKNFSDFKSSVADISDRFNSQYLQTEYDTAYSTALNVSEYADKVSDFPYVMWHQIDRPTAREEHEELDGEIYQTEDLPGIPPSDWNCGCSLDYLTEDDIEGKEISSHEDLKETLNWSEMEKYGFAENKAETGNLMDLNSYDGIPDSFELDDLGLEPTSELSTSNYESTDIEEISKSIIQDKIKNNPDEIYLQKTKKGYKNIYLKYFNLDGELVPSFVEEEFNPKSKNILNFGVITKKQADKIRTTNILTYERNNKSN